MLTAPPASPARQLLRHHLGLGAPFFPRPLPRALRSLTPALDSDSQITITCRGGDGKEKYRAIVEFKDEVRRPRSLDPFSLSRADPLSPLPSSAVVGVEGALPARRRRVQVQRGRREGRGVQPDQGRAFQPGRRHARGLLAQADQLQAQGLQGACPRLLPPLRRDLTEADPHVPPSLARTHARSRAC